VPQYIMMTIVARADGCNGTPTQCATLRHTWSDEGLDCNLSVSPKEEKDLENRHKNDEQSVRVDELENTYRRIMAATSGKPGEFDTSSISSCTDSSTANYVDLLMYMYYVVLYIHSFCHCRRPDLARGFLDES